jgi:hypothetical protein
MIHPVTLIYAPPESKLAARVRADLETAGVSVHSTVQPGREALLLVLLSPATQEDRAVQQAIINALDNSQHVVPLMAAPVELPRLIDNLEPLDFSENYDAQALLRRLEHLSRSDAPPPLIALTPARRAANRRTGLFISFFALVSFVIALVMIAVWGYGPPEDEFASVETQIFLTRNYFIDNALPRTTEEAANFSATLERARPSVQPYLALTATAIAEGVQGSFVPRTTEEALNFEVTARLVSTIVREELIATVTAAAADGAGEADSEPTATPEPGE